MAHSLPLLCLVALGFARSVLAVQWMQSKLYDTNNITDHFEFKTLLQRYGGQEYYSEEEGRKERVFASMAEMLRLCRNVCSQLEHSDNLLIVGRLTCIRSLVSEAGGAENWIDLMYSYHDGGYSRPGVRVSTNKPGACNLTYQGGSLPCDAGDGCRMEDSKSPRVNNLGSASYAIERYGDSLKIYTRSLETTANEGDLVDTDQWNPPVVHLSTAGCPDWKKQFASPKLVFSIEVCAEGQGLPEWGNMNCTQKMGRRCDDHVKVTEDLSDTKFYILDVRRYKPTHDSTEAVDTASEDLPTTVPLAGSPPEPASTPISTISSALSSPEASQKAMMEGAWVKYTDELKTEKTSDSERDEEESQRDTLKSSSSDSGTDSSRSKSASKKTKESSPESGSDLGSEQVNAANLRKLRGHHGKKKGKSLKGQKSRLREKEHMMGDQATDSVQFRLPDLIGNCTLVCDPRVLPERTQRMV